MITKGTQHDNGTRLAGYLTRAKEGENAELWQLRGFGTNTNIKDAFRDVHVMAEATKASQPFFHAVVRLPKEERLSRPQWEQTADRIEGMLGLKDQPRAIAFHISKQTGEEHMHVAWSRIDAEEMKAIPLPFFKDRLKKLSRELELHFGLTQVTSHRNSEIEYAPTKAEEQQARRLGTDIHQIRETIRGCYETSDCGRSFQSALAEQGLTLAKGDRRDYLVIDEAGGVHALGKRILGETAAQVRNRLADLDRTRLPTLEQAREQTLARDLAQIEVTQRETRDKQKAMQAEIDQPAEEHNWDRDRADAAWQDSVIDAAIRAGNTGRGQHEAGPTELTGPRAHIREARQHSDNPQAFIASLAEHGIGLAQATRADAVQSQIESAEAQMAGTWKPAFREGEVVAVSARGDVYRLTPRTTGDKDYRDIQSFLAGLKTPLPSILDTQHQRQREQDLEHLKPHGRGPLRGGMMAQQAWAMDRVKAADEYRRKEEERRGEQAAQSAVAEAEIDPGRYQTDPDYRREVRLAQNYKTPEERKADRENELRAVLEEQDRQR